jgi:hypothetical protein
LDFGSFRFLGVLGELSRVQSLEFRVQGFKAYSLGLRGLIISAEIQDSGLLIQGIDLNVRRL